jgi:hypothetical protein
LDLPNRLQDARRSLLLRPPTRTMSPCNNGQDAQQAKGGVLRKCQERTHAIMACAAGMESRCRTLGATQTSDGVGVLQVYATC